MASVTISNGKQFDAGNNQTILDAALQNNIILEYSCRTGRCGICKTSVVTGDTFPIKSEECLSKDEINDGQILTCCREARGDIVLKSDDLGILVDYPAKTIPCRIKSITKLSPDIVEVSLRFPPGQELRYLPGQYVDVIGNSGVRRSYSIANAPRNDGSIVLYIRRVEAGVMSNYWFNEARQNDLLRLEGPLGTFYFRDSLPRNIVFLATGTGIAPVKAMLERFDEEPEGVEQRCIHVFWGNRARDDFFWEPDFKNISIDYSPVSSRPTAGWSGLSGYVQDCLLGSEVDITDSVVYACGSSSMIQSARNSLVPEGLSEEHFYSDAFVSSSS